MNKNRNRFKKPTGEKHDKAFTDKWFAYLNGDSKAKEGVTYKNVFLDDFEKMDKTKKYIDAIKRDRKKPSSKKSNKEIGVVHPALETRKNSKRNSVQDDASDEVLKSVESENPNEFVSTWEELPTGDWLPNDENGVNWYQDEEGRYWHSTDDGFRVWKE